MVFGPADGPIDELLDPGDPGCALAPRFVIATASLRGGKRSRVTSKNWHGPTCASCGRSSPMRCAAHRDRHGAMRLAMTPTWPTRLLPRAGPV